MVTLTYCHDALNRLTAKAYSAETCTNGTLPSPIATYTYDQGNTSAYPIGHRTGMSDLAGSETRTYDQMGRVKAIQRTNNSYPSAVQMTTSYGYNYDGSVANLTYPSGRILTYVPGGAGLVLSALDTLNGVNFVTNAHYTAHRALASLTNGLGLFSTYIFNGRLQLCWLYTTTGTPLPWSTTLCGGTTTVGTVLDLQYNFAFGVSDNGNVYGVTNNRDVTRSQSFTYDSLNRISTAQTTSTYSTSPANCWGEQLSYDAWGNLLGIASLSSAYSGCSGENLSVGATNQNQISGDTYDTSGNLTVELGPTMFSYDAENHLTSAAGQTYNYDGDGKRVSKALSSAPTHPTKLYWYSVGSDVLDETDGSGNTANSTFSEYLFFAASRIARRDFQNNVFYYFSDHIGTARVLVQAGQTAACYESDFYPFGDERMPTINACSQNYKFTGKERDSESSLDYFGARYYASGLGRFTSRDTGPFDWNDPQTLNRYAYTRNNPLRFVDPTGKYFVIATTDPNYGEFRQAIAKLLLSSQGAAAVEQVAQSPKPVFYQSGNLGGATQNANGSTSLTLGKTEVIETTKPSQDGSHLVGVSSGIVVTVDYGNVAAGSRAPDVTIGHETSHAVDALQAGDSFAAAVGAAAAGDAPNSAQASDTTGGTAEQFGQTVISDANMMLVGVSDDVLAQVAAEAEAIIANGNAQCAQNQCTPQSGNTTPQPIPDAPTED